MHATAIASLMSEGSNQTMNSSLGMGWGVRLCCPEKGTKERGGGAHANARRAKTINACRSPIRLFTLISATRPMVRPRASG